MSQRVTLAQNQLQLAQTNPQMHNLYEAYRRMYTALGVKDVEQYYLCHKDHNLWILHKNIVLF